MASVHEALPEPLHAVKREPLRPQDSARDHAVADTAPLYFAGLRVLRLTIDQYHQRIEAGVFAGDLRAELLEGVIVHMTPIGPPHYCVQSLIGSVFRRIFDRNGTYVGQRRPITMADSEPEPDIVVIRGDLDDYRERHPSPSEVPLVVEVADSSLAFDRGPKAKLYAAAGIPKYWIVNLIDRQVEVHTNPRPADGDEPAACAEKKVYSATDRGPVSLLGKPLGEVAAAEFLP